MDQPPTDIDGVKSPGSSSDFDTRNHDRQTGMEVAGIIYLVIVVSPIV
ncbi:hypothetical protein Patl1_26333 [Pistacia atlantica]|uniref:Uncharacterized protein n=1 Tax=Pistacia atlantica TaxID=434234 RepID=A0ACC1B542_9ROSI|nr:hypothetical protein Patl1_26333 [Pistacia atlantica]